jgi:NAD(P)-dependent dehydrogenase (short-subunit alcohol dehydrogenase family)
VQSVFSTIASESSAAFPSILINAAGYVSTSPLEETPPDEITKHLLVNVLGPTLCSQSFARLYLAASKERSSSAPLAPGRIVSISSQAAHVALDKHGAYCASKAALIGLTKCMASEWGVKGITANTVSPTVALTELGKKAWPEGPVRDDFLKTIPTGRFAMPEDVADAIVFLCRDESAMINGADVRVDGGFTIR